MGLAFAACAAAAAIAIAGAGVHTHAGAAREPGVTGHAAGSVRADGGAIDDRGARGSTPAAIRRVRLGVDAAIRAAQEARIALEVATRCSTSRHGIARRSAYRSTLATVTGVAGQIDAGAVACGQCSAVAGADTGFAELARPASGGAAAAMSAVGAGVDA